MKRILFLLFLVLGVLFHALEAKAAMIKVLGWDNPNVNPSYVIEGNIVEGDYDKFKEVVFQYGALPYTVRIYSKGGNVVEAMKIGRMIRDLKFGTSVPSGADPNTVQCYDGFIEDQANRTCQSACFFIYAGGIDRAGDIIGIHRAYLDFETQKGMSAEKAATFSKEISSDVASYLSDMGVPQKIIDEANYKSSDEISWIKQGDVENYLSGYIPELDDWFIGNCGSIQELYKPMDALRLKKDRKGLSESESEELSKIYAIFGSRLECRKKKERDLRLDAFRVFAQKNYGACKNMGDFAIEPDEDSTLNIYYSLPGKSKPHIWSLIGETEGVIKDRLRCLGMAPKSNKVDPNVISIYQKDSNLDYIHYGIEIVYESSEMGRKVASKIILHLKHSSLPGLPGRDYYGYVYAGTTNELKNSTTMMDRLGRPPDFARDNREYIGLSRAEIINLGGDWDPFGIYKITFKGGPIYVGFRIVTETLNVPEYISKVYFLNRREFDNLEGKIVPLDELRNPQ